ncbi:NAD-dependent epimerase/dehydratase family protein [Actinopolymorpha cephalotaxi]|uniref:NAD-dependent epimerase/dehydratase family protein n=1 Tax=Actinopolymorpha cephalotaxi TaxID=504797 RepID=UPI0036314C56
MGARVVRGDVTNADQVAREVPEHDAVVHLAALVGFPLCDLDPVRADAVNVGGTRNVVAAMPRRASRPNTSGARESVSRRSGTVKPNSGVSSRTPLPSTSTTSKALMSSRSRGLRNARRA